MRVLTAVSALALLAVSCTREPPLQLVSARFTGTCLSTETKSATDVECSFEKMELFVFRSDDGQLEARAWGNGSSPLDVTVTRNRNLRWYLIANAPKGRIPDCTKEEDFLETTVLLGDGFVMHDQGEVVLRENNTVINAKLSRYICKVGIGSIHVDWPDALPCSVKTVALMSALGSTPISGVPAQLEPIYNCGIIDTDFSGKLSTSPGVEVNTSLPVNLDITLWCMPNPSDGDSYGLPWQYRRTRIAICVNAWGQENWYPIDLPPMEGNRYYSVDDIVIKGPGAPAPDVKPERVLTSFTVRVLDWEEETAPAQF